MVGMDIGDKTAASQKKQRAMGHHILFFNSVAIRNDVRLCICRRELLREARKRGLRYRVTVRLGHVPILT